MKLVIWICTKANQSDQYLNYNSHHPFAQKIGCVENLIDWGIKLSDVQFRKENLNQIREVLILNNYPLPLINSLIKKIINEIYNNSIKNKRKETWLKNYNKNDKKLTLPYIQRLSERIRSSFKNSK